MFEIGMSSLVLKICSEYAKALGLNFPPCVQQEINAIAQYVDLHTVKDLKVEQNGSVVTITCFTKGEQEKIFTVTLPESEVNVDVLFNLIKGSSSVVVDKSEDGTHLVVRLDKSQEVQYVELTPASAKNGFLTVTQLNILQANKGNCIILNNEIYRLADNEKVEGVFTYVHTDLEGTVRKDKSIQITVPTKAWSLWVGNNDVGKFYLHSMSFTGDLSAYGAFYGYLITNEETATDFTLESLNTYLTELYNSEMIVYKNFAVRGYTSVGVFHDNRVYEMAGVDFEGNATSANIIDITQFTDTVTVL